MIWSCLPFIRSGQIHLARHSERGKKTRQTEEEVGRQHQGMDRETSGKGTVSIGGRTITNLRFADDIDGLAGGEELATLVERLDKTSTASGMI